MNVSPSNHAPEKSILALLQGAAANYKPGSMKKDTVVEIELNDLDERYQVVFGETSCTVLTRDFQKSDVRAETTADIFWDIAEGEKNAAMAILKRQVKVSGDARLLPKLSALFSKS